MISKYGKMPVIHANVKLTKLCISQAELTPTRMFISDPKRDWNSEELIALQNFRKNDSSWESIASFLNRSVGSCTQKYYSVVMEENKWNDYNISTLLNLVVKYGENWQRISEEIQSTSDV